MRRRITVARAAASAAPWCLGVGEGDEVGEGLTGVILTPGEVLVGEGAIVRVSF